MASRPEKTLDRVLSRAGLGSRTEARRWIALRRVTVNGQVVIDPMRWSTPNAIGSPSTAARSGARKRSICSLQAQGNLTTYDDPAGRKTVYDLLPRDRYLFPVGRLDLDTSGLLVMTSDSAFAERLTNPLHEIAKTYLVKASTHLDDAQLEALRSGVVLKDGPTRPARVTRLREAGGRTVFEITLTEGRNRRSAAWSKR